jgi:16S rRNA (cytidine1402-2'-O)-methyltransferase
MATSAGILYLVGTPIGNLGDLTQRAVDVLSQVSHVAAEDTRRSRALLTHLKLANKKLHRVDAHASDRQLARIVELLVEGESVALVTDAGMPAVSDPGALLVRRAASAGIAVRCLPGPSAVTAAVALSGLVTGAFWFAGFLPKQGGKRRRAIDRIVTCPDPVVLFEAPGRTAATLRELADRIPERDAVVCRELTKLHEQTLRGTVSELALRSDAWRGEIVLVLGPPSEDAVQEHEQPLHPDLDARIAERLRQGAPTKTIAAELAEQSSLTRREAYARVQAVRDRVGCRSS